MLCVCVCVYIRVVQANRKPDETDGTNHQWPDSIPLSIGYGSSISKTDFDGLSGRCTPPKPKLPNSIGK